MAQATPIFSPPNNDRRRALISLTPLIDVVFILLVFFMLASSFLDWRAVELSTAEAASTASAEDTNSLVLTVTENGLALVGEPMQLAGAEREIRARLRAGTAGTVVRVEIGEGVSLQRVIRVAEMVQRAGGEVALAPAAGAAL